MKLSLKFQDHRRRRRCHRHCQKHILLKAKIPISIFNQPFISTTTTTSDFLSDLTFSLSTDFCSGLSGIGLFGSPHKSPPIFFAHLSLPPTNTPITIFSLLLNPQFDRFALKKSTFSNLGSNQIIRTFSNVEDNVINGSYSNARINMGPGSHSFGSWDGSSIWQELKLENCGDKDGVIKSNSIENGGAYSNGGYEFAPERHLAWNNSGKEGFLFGFAAMKNTIFPVTKRFVVNLWWGVNFPVNARKRMSYLTMNKICIERIEQVKYAEINSGESNVGDLKLLKGLCSWTIRHLEKQNREIKQSLEEMRARISMKKYR
ncbi:hypothetical protein I3843_12G060400 [Carya illinoinensis]|nr:hypothetical protein I3843_12G060400 [Carya illinoinensis]